MAIVVKNLSFQFGNVSALRHITLRINEGRFTALLGRNGSGKSTLLKILAGILACPQDMVYVMGHDLSHLTGIDRARLIGYLPQFHDSVFPFTVEDVILTGRAAYISFLPGNKDRNKATEAIERAGISHLKGRPYTELSGGERQMVMIARLLAQDAKIILLDEPFSFLDLHNQARLISLIKSLVAAGLTVLAVLHDPNIAFMHADEFVLLKGGEVICPADDDTPWSSEMLRRLYDVEVETIPFRTRRLVAPL